VKEENKAGTENEIQMLKIQILELKEKNDEFDREKLNLKT
jgi:FtsZ-binding cell division protein ZapB